MHRDRNGNRQRRVIEPVIVDIVGKTVGPIRPGGNFCAGHAFGIVEKFSKIRRCHFRAIAVEHFAEFPCPGAAGGELRLQVADDPIRQTHVYFNQLEQGIVGYPRFEQFERRNTQTFLEYLRGITGIRPRYPAADIGVMTDHDGKALQVRLSIENRHEHEDIGQMHPALVGIVQDHSIAGHETVAILFQDHAHSFGNRAEMQRNRLGLGNHISLRVADRGGVIHHILDDLGPRRADDIVSHFIDDRVEAVLDHCKRDRIYLNRHSSSPSRCRGPI